MTGGRALRRHAWLVVSGLVATLVVLGGGGPAPGQVPDPSLPEVRYVEIFGPGIYGYEDCEGTVHTEEVLSGQAFLELDEIVETDLAVAISFGGSLLDELVDPPTEAVVPAGDGFAEVTFTLDTLELGDLTIAVEPGPGYEVDGDVTATIEVEEDPIEVSACDDDLSWMIVEGRDRQTIEVGERPQPFGFFDGFVIEPDEPGPGPTTTAEGVATSGPSTSVVPVARVPRAVPAGIDTPVSAGAVPPGLTYADDTWSGAATTPGTYDFQVRVCSTRDIFFGVARTGRAVERPAPRAFPNQICLGTLSARVVVEAAAVTPPPDRPDPPSPPAPPARPVRTTARFAG